jgi:hypothetical protein
MIRPQCIQLFDEVDDTHWVHRDHAYADQSHVAHSQLLVCPRCCTPWAKLRFDDDDLCWPMSQFCEHCPLRDDWHPVPGSLLVEEGWGVVDDSLLQALPLSLLKREFDLHLKAFS